jgi:octaprenyl-diphosphate synthase
VIEGRALLIGIELAHFNCYLESDLQFVVEQTLDQSSLSAVSDDCLGALANLLQEDMGAVDLLIYEYMQSKHSPFIPAIAEHIIQSGGKRLRPILTLAFTRIFQDDMTQSHKLATTVEFIHTATLLHDDVVDRSDMRRGVISANKKWSEKPCILVGDYLFSRAFQLMVDVQNLDVLRILSNAAAVIAEGEVLQLSITGNLKTTVQDYMTAIEGKTATLFSSACESGAYITPASQAQIKAARDYGYSLGMAFQLTDDALDYGGSTASLGKKVGNDFREGKLTYPVLHAYSCATPDEKTFWKSAIVEGVRTDQALHQAQALMVQHNSLEATLECAQNFIKRAQDAADLLPACEIQALLKELPDFILNRCS